MSKLYVSFVFRLKEFDMSKSVTGYFGSPVDGSFELAWFMRQFFRLFSVRISERWYEAKGHRRVNTILALFVLMPFVNTIISVLFILEFFMKGKRDV